MNLFGKSKRELELELELQGITDTLIAYHWNDVDSLCRYASDAAEKLKDKNSEIAELRRELELSRIREKRNQDKLYTLIENNEYYYKYANHAMYLHLITRIQRDNVVYELERRNADILQSMQRKGSTPEKIERAARRNKKKLVKSINRRPKKWDAVFSQEYKIEHQNWIKTKKEPIIPIEEAFRFLDLEENRWSYS